MTSFHAAAIAPFVLAKALKDLFPKIQLIGEFSQNVHFSYDFIADFEVDNRALQFLNDRISLLIREEIEISSHEMLRDGALSMFQATGERVWVTLIKELDKKTLISLVKISDLYCLTSHHYSFREPIHGYIKLLSSKKERVYHPCLKEGEVQRISGCFESSPKALKEKVKQGKEAEKRAHEVLGKKLSLFEKSGEEIIYKEEGAYALHAFEEICALAHGEQNCAWIKAPCYSVSNFFSELGFSAPLWDKRSYLLGGDRLDFPSSCLLKGKDPERCGFAEVSLKFRKISSRETRGLWLSQAFHRDESYCFLPYKECHRVLISSLHFIQKNVNMSLIESLWFSSLLNQEKGGENSLPEAMPFEALMKSEFFTRGLKKETLPQRFALFYNDAFGEFWEGPSVEITQVSTHIEKKINAFMGWQDKIALIKTSLFGSFERFLAFSLEKNQALPASLKRKEFRDTDSDESDWPKILLERGERKRFEN